MEDDEDSDIDLPDDESDGVDLDDLLDDDGQDGINVQGEKFLSGGKGETLDTLGERLNIRSDT
jgi:hypothetical protein